jgi:hypothetical protein
MANISIKDGKSRYEKLFGSPSPITPETCVSFGRIGYVTSGHASKYKYRSRALVYDKFSNMNQGKQEKLLLQEMLDGYIGIIQINQNQWVYCHYLQKLKDQRNIRKHYWKELLMNSLLIIKCALRSSLKITKK